MYNQNKIFTQYRDPMNPYESMKDRKYTVTHSDTTAELFVTIGKEYAVDQFSEMRDEVRLCFTESECEWVLYGEVIVDQAGIKGDAAIRNEIFGREMPKALEALRYADRFFFETHCELNATPIIIHFVSCNAKYNKIYSFGTIGDYAT